MENSIMKRSTGLYCQACGAAAGHPCTVDCPEGGLAISADRTITMLTALDLAKLPLAVTAVIGLLRGALDAQQQPAAPETASINTEAFERDLAAYIGHLEFHEDCGHPAVIEAHAALLAHIAPRRQSAPAATISADQHSDDVAVDRFAAAMKAKMAASRAKGRRGWVHPDECAMEYLWELLDIEINDPDGRDVIDIGNFAMILFNRKGCAA